MPNQEDAPGITKRNEKNVDPKVYTDALSAFLTALGVDGDTAFRVDADKTGAIINHVRFTPQPNGVQSGEFWDDVISRKKPTE